jgi:hypothetical protein
MHPIDRRPHVPHPPPQKHQPHTLNTPPPKKKNPKTIHNKQVTITGDPANVQAAAALVRAVMESGPSALQAYGGGGGYGMGMGMVYGGGGMGASVMGAGGYTAAVTGPDGRAVRACVCVCVYFGG